ADLVAVERIRQGEAAEPAFEARLCAVDRALLSHRAATVEEGGGAVEVAPAGVGEDTADGDVVGEELDGVVEVLAHGEADVDDGLGAELLGDPAHGVELGRGDLKSEGAPPEPRAHLDQAALLDAVVLDDLGR